MRSWKARSDQVGQAGWLEYGAPFRRSGRDESSLFTRSRRPACLVLLSCVLMSPIASAGRGADGEYDERSSSHFVLYQDVDIDRTSGLYGSRQFELDVLETLETAFRSLEELLGIRPRNEITVTIHDPRIFDARFAGIFRFPAAGFYGGTVHIRGATSLSDSLIAVLHHELVHAAFDSELGSMYLPAWFNEGVAEWFEARSLGRRRLTARELSALASRARAGELFSLADLSTGSFGHLGPEAARAAYLQSFGFFEYLTRVHGDRRLRDLCRDLTRTADLERSFRRSYGKLPAKLEADYLEDLRSSRY